MVWLFKIRRNLKRNWDLYSKTYTFYFKVLGHSIMWICCFKYLLHNWTWVHTFHIQRISRPHSCKGPRAWNSAAGRRGAHLCVIPNNVFPWPAPVLSVPCAPESKWTLTTSLFCTLQSEIPENHFRCVNCKSESFQICLL